MVEIDLSGLDFRLHSAFTWIMTDDPDLDSAYALQTPEDSKRLYADWAETYDQSFAETSDYQLPEIVAQAFAAAGGQGPVLDLGAGTGLCGEVLAPLITGGMDGTDISPEMLEVARTKGVYTRLFTGDLTARLPVDDRAYCGIVSSGTFTNGHVGPDALDEVLRVTAPNGLIVLSINAEHFERKGFGAKLKALAPLITGLKLPEIRFYGDKAAGPHKDDTGFIATFRKA